MNSYETEINLNKEGFAAGWPLTLAAIASNLHFLGSATDSEGSFLKQVVWMAIFFAASITLLRGRALAFKALKHANAWMCIVIGYAFLSIFWSWQPFTSFKRCILLAGVFLISWSVHAHGGRMRMLEDSLLPVTTGLLVLSLVVIALVPSVGTELKGWRGIMQTKNQFGQIALLSVILWVCFIRKTSGWQSIMAVFPLVLSVVSLFFSRSVTSWGAFFGVVFVLVVRFLWKAVKKGWGPVIGGLFLAVLVASHLALMISGDSGLNFVWDSVFRLLSREPSLAGRTYLWQLMWHEILKHPWFGAGYGGFWLGLDGPSGLISWLVQWGYPGQAHNGYIDIFNELGLVGLLLVSLMLLSHSLNLRKLARLRFDVSMFHLLVLTSMVILNVAEASLLRLTHFWWIILMVSMFEVSYLVDQQEKEPLGLECSSRAVS